MDANVRIGASGFSYKEWLGHFYPAKLAGSKMLPYYAERLPAVEINYDFHHHITPEKLDALIDGLKSAKKAN